MTVFRFFTVLITVLLIGLAIFVFFAARQVNANDAACSELGGRWIDRYQLCLSNDAIIPMPS